MVHPGVRTREVQTEQALEAEPVTTDRDAMIITIAHDRVTVVDPETNRAIVKVARKGDGWVVEPSPHATIQLGGGIEIDPLAPFATEDTDTQ